ncbi:DUF1192 domain-containing protein [Hyphobacterium sp.]|jgi:uncharacterized small protein (DUF1192 family)|uniref:DUF1192 domain-containing protein n=1 Tax=Hyphobacterium sp. TaxID=2004662 RepID=UPI00374988F7
MFDDDAPLKTHSNAIIPGEDLSEFSIEGLKERRDTIEGEIARIDAMIASKESGREAAESIFKQG